MDIRRIRKTMIKVLPILLVALILVNNVLGIGWNKAEADQVLNESSNIGSASNLAKNIWATVIMILRILAVAAVVLAGIRYMFASASDKADIKKQLVILVVGAILVFAGSFVVEVIVGVTEQALGN